MASETLTQTPVDTATLQSITDSPGESRPIEALQIEEPSNEEENIAFPTGPKLWSTMASMSIALFLSGLDITIVAVAVPSITDEFQTIADIGWYSAAYGMSLSAFVFFLLSGVGSLGLITAPTIGGALVDAFSWRACFGVNIPLGVLCLILTWYGVHESSHHRENAPVLTLKEKLKKIDFLGTLIAVPAVTCLLMALQWGGTKFGWGSWQIILPLVFCALLFTAFGYLQYRQGDKALLPPRILKQRSIIAAFMLATSVLTPIVSGLLTTIDFEEQVTKAVILLTFLGLAVGLGLNSPMIALQAVLPVEDVSLGGAILTFGAGMGSSLWICASATLFQDRLVNEIKLSSPGTNVDELQKAGLSKMRESIGPERLKSVLGGYENAVIQTLYIPLALAVLTIVGSLAMERKSIKKKQS
ncbi:Efflux pump afoB [Fusarium culmorum]|uniref:Efflux pump afoB n=1 Tax=Fusarium culmorum TaxID=5516 RepID=A0A2T4GXJ9_FUSCU|nr:Efflux pump afoB [Fusarium culmorum]